MFGFVDNMSDFIFFVIIALEPICTLALSVTGSNKPKKNRQNNMELIRVNDEYIWIEGDEQ